VILDFLLRRSAGGARVVTSQDLARALDAGTTSSAGVNVTPTRALQYAAVFSCVRVLAESVGQLPLQLYERRGREKVKAIDHPLYQLLHVAPNDHTTAQEFWEWVISCLALRGNAYAQIVRIRGGARVAELIPWQPGAVTPRQDPQTLEVSYDVTLGGGQRETFPARDVLHIKLFPIGGIVGASPIAYARNAIGLAIATEQHGAGLFGNGASPGGVLYTDQVLGDGRKLLQDAWNDAHRGSENAGKVAVLERGLKWQSISMPSTDAQWLEGRKYQRSEIAGIYRVPPHLIGDLERATFSNIEHQALDFVVHALMPYLTRIEQRISLQLLTPSERGRLYAKFSVGGLLRGDMNARAQFYTRMVQNGAMSPNEIRELEDMNPRDGGDVFLTPANMLIDGQPTHAP
jgi:HK97 family phage portal protein